VQLHCSSARRDSLLSDALRLCTVDTDALGGRAAGRRHSSQILFLMVDREMGESVQGGRKKIASDQLQLLLYV